jgi:hypothetical protein
MIFYFAENIIPYLYAGRFIYRLAHQNAPFKISGTRRLSPGFFTKENHRNKILWFSYFAAKLRPRIFKNLICRSSLQSFYVSRGTAVYSVKDIFIYSLWFCQLCPPLWRLAKLCCFFIAFPLTIAEDFKFFWIITP